VAAAPAADDARPPPRALAAAARRVVVVEVLPAGVSDVPLAAVAARHLCGRLLRGDVRIWELGGGRQLHAKTAGVFDGRGAERTDALNPDDRSDVKEVVAGPALGFGTERRW